MGKMLMQTIEQYFQKKQCTVIFVEVFAQTRVPMISTNGQDTEIGITI